MMTQRLAGMRTTALLLGLATAGVLLLADARSAAQQGPGTQWFRGFVTPSRQVELATPVEEILRTLEVREGDRVEQGQVVAVLDDALQVVIVEAARLRAQSDAAVQSTALELERVRGPAPDDGGLRPGAATDGEVDHVRIAALQAEAALQEAREKQALARVNLRLEEQRLARYRVRAPFDGTVLELLAESGAMLTSEDAILLLVDLDTLEAHLNLPAPSTVSSTVAAGEHERARQPAEKKTANVSLVLAAPKRAASADSL